MKMVYSCFILFFIVVSSKVSVDAAAASTKTRAPIIQDVQVEILIPNKLPKNAKILTPCLPYIIRPDKIAFCRNGELAKSDGCCGTEGSCIIPYPFCGDCPKGCIN